ncbi:hypothetical protein [Thiolapillus sp.]|uniref:hypothetical protein n=1 Tax=Thiolapillus sp. TaxID=2017437 RepID=UPI0025D2254C|nr:hypothetical protein [Thiolapillus sp.]
MPQACLRPRDRFWDIPVPKIYHEVEDTLELEQKIRVHVGSRRGDWRAATETHA